MLVRIRKDLVHAEAKRKKWEQVGQDELAATIANLDKQVAKFGEGVSRGAAEAAISAINVFAAGPGKKKAREAMEARLAEDGESADQLKVSKRAAAAGRGLARFSEITSRTVSKLRTRVAGHKLLEGDPSTSGHTSPAGMDRGGNGTKKKRMKKRRKKLPRTRSTASRVSAIPE